MKNIDIIKAKLIVLQNELKASDSRCIEYLLGEIGEDEIKPVIERRLNLRAKIKEYEELIK